MSEAKGERSGLGARRLFVASLRVGRLLGQGGRDAERRTYSDQDLRGTRRVAQIGTVTI